MPERGLRDQRHRVVKERARGSMLADDRLQALARARIALGCLFLLRTTPLGLLLHVGEHQSTIPLLGWPAVGWAGHVIVSLPASVVQALCIVRTLAGAAFVAGYHARIAGLVAGVSGFAVLSQEPFAFIFTLHLLYLGTIVLALVDSGGVWAVRPEPSRSPSSSLRLVRAFVASIYGWAGAYKLRLDWLDGRTLALYHRDHALQGPLADALLATGTLRAAAATSVAITELSLVPLLLCARTQRLGVAIAVGFHAAIQLMASPDVLGLEMGALLLALWARPQARYERVDDGDRHA